MSPFNLGKGKYKHRIANDPGFKGEKLRPTGFSLDQTTRDHIEDIAIQMNTNRSAALRRIIQKVYEEMGNAEHVA